jgi:uroporphyrinogen decarboxylase
MIPEFEEKVIEVRESSQIVQDWKGNICEIGLEFGTEYLREAIDFVTRRWIKCPVESRDDWEAMKQRWDDPEMIRDMVFFWTDYVAGLLERGFEYCVPDEVHLSEDMAYKAFSMISPDMAREFLMPAWAAWGEVIRSHGVPVYAMDSDGFIGELIPLWIEAGINACDPIEVAAHNDIVAFRERFGSRMAYRGGVDKRAMAAGGETLSAELARIEPVVHSGGYIPSCDHGIPSDVSWQNYLDYVRGLAKITGWL